MDLAADPPSALAAAIAHFRPSAVVNCVGRVVGSPQELERANVSTVARLIEALSLSRRPPRLIHLGSAAEYGPRRPGHPVAENAIAHPTVPYAETKLAATDLVWIAARQGRIDAVVLRVFNPLGPGMGESTLAGAAVRRLRHALAEQSPEIHMGPLGAVRDFVDVRDVGRAVQAAASQPHLEAGIVNIGSGIGHTARDLVESLAARSGFRGSIREDSTASARSVGIPWQVADISLARRTLAWEPRYKFEDTITAIVEGERLAALPTRAPR
jgi:nucleoside-diphosphate-sugar epimerase